VLRSTYDDHNMFIVQVTGSIMVLCCCAISRKLKKQFCHFYSFLLMTWLQIFAFVKCF